MAKISIPYNKNENFEISVPTSNLAWTARLESYDDHRDSLEKMVRDSLKHPISTKPLNEIVKSDQRVTLIVDDLTRPTPVKQLLPFLFEELSEVGIPDQNIKIVIALGTHRRMTEEEIIEKCGNYGNKFEVINADYNQLNNYVTIGTGSQGEPIQILRAVAEADVKIAIGNIVPHIYAGWGGGAKIVQPGVCGEATTEVTHTFGVLKDNVLNLCVNPDNIVRREIEKIASQVGLDFIVNTVMNERKEILKIFSGDFIKAYREGVKFAERIFRPEISQLADIVISTAYPSQIDYWQGIKSLVFSQFGVKKGGITIFAMSAEEGLAGGNEKHATTIKSYAKKSEDSIRKAIEAKESKDLIALAFCLSHVQMIRRGRIFCISKGIDADLLSGLGFIPANSINSALNEAFKLKGEDARVGIITYGGLVVKLKEAKEV
jgi:nickel-dependent lactate racemase